MISWPKLLESIGVLFAAALMGALIGFERERADHPAGLRTHILVCLGSALFTLTSIQLAGARWDPGRVAAQIVSGIGFLGAGTILHHGNIIRGLTTAASLWVVAGIGMGVAASYQTAILAAVSTLLVFFTLTTVNRLEDTYVSRRGFRGLTISMHADRDAVGELLLGLAEQEVEIRRAAIGPAEVPDRFEVQILLRPPAGHTIATLSAWLSRQRGVVRFDWE
jgi:putative Mg2+ transporter-C (MgtC) family protein